MANKKQSELEKFEAEFYVYLHVSKKGTFKV